MTGHQAIDQVSLNVFVCYCPAFILLYVFVLYIFKIRLWFIKLQDIVV